MNIGTWLKTSVAMLGVVSLASLNGAAATKSSPEDIPMTYDQEMKAAQDALRKDPAWKPALEEVALIQMSKGAKAVILNNYCLDPAGNILACCGHKPGRDNPSGEVRVISPAGELLKTWPLEIMPQAICAGSKGEIFVAGSGRVLRLDAEGKVIASADTPVAKEPVVMGKDIDDMLKQMNKLNDSERRRMKETLERRRKEVTGVALTDQDVFLACPAPSDFTYRVYRFDHELKNPKLVVEKLRGCCGQMDIQAHAGNLWIPHNARHQVESHDRDGKPLASFGKRGRVKPDQFGGCCEPKNLRITSNGEILAAESGPPTCIKRFSQDGKFLGVVALLNTKGDCVRVTVEVSPDGKRYYMLDTTRDAIRVFGAKS